ncbi:hypothetical protein MVEN_01095800 [Mycena venus]|uniref:DUF6534 domain-containing protein n=1 Tax=Mycena venus TaxID=2733690 RepID=A0A8H7CXE5_9AGAR|nr:hypothetical protein MVEN_01095800 [Mycena venus]
MSVPFHLTQLPSGVEIAQLSGPVLLGYLLNWCLFGTLSLQLYLYYQAFPQDVLWNRCLVYTVYAIEFVQTMLMTNDAFSTFAYGFGDLSALTSLRLEWFALPILTGLVAFIVQSFYAYRVYILSESWKAPLFIILIALVSSAGAFVHGGVTGHEDRTSDLWSSGEIYASAAVWLFGSALSDLVSATCLTYYLYKSDIGFRSTSVWLHNLMCLTIETGSLTALMALVHLTLFFAFPSEPYFFTAAAIQPKLYANTILAVLNSRLKIVGGRGSTFTAGTEVITNGQSGSRGLGRSSILPTHMGREREVFSAQELNDLVKRAP